MFIKKNRIKKVFYDKTQNPIFTPIAHVVYSQKNIF